MGRRKRSNNNFCLVCESPNAISQFGALTCRACGAFFRRLVLSKRKYDCDCEVRLRGKVETVVARKQRISTCRGCRMRRCFEAGMKEKTVKTGKQNIVELEKNSEIQQQINIFSEERKSTIFIKILLEIAEKANHIFLNVRGFNNQFLDKYATFEQLIQSKDNLLAHSDFYAPRPIAYFDIARFEENITKHGLFHTEPISFTKTLLLMIDFAKAMPVFSRLSLKDQLVKTLNQHFHPFYSMFKCLDDVLTSSNISEVDETFTACLKPAFQIYSFSLKQAN